MATVDDLRFGAHFAQNLTHLQTQQREMTRIHEQYLQQQGAFSRLFAQLLSQQQGLLLSQESSAFAATALQNLRLNLALLNQNQAETLHSHEHSLRNQVEYNHSMAQVLQQQQTSAVIQPETLAPPVAQKEVYAPATAFVKAIVPSSRIENGVWLAESRLKSLPRPDFLEWNLAPTQICLLLSDGTSLTAKLAEALSARNWRVVVGHFPQTIIPADLSLPPTVPQITLPDLTENNLSQLIQTLTASFGPIGAFIHLNPMAQTASNGHNFLFEAEKFILRYVFLLAKYLKQPLNQAALQGRSCFLTVTRLDGALGLGAETSFGAIGGGLLGLTKALRLEWDAVFCRALDLSSQFSADQAVATILAELHDPNRLLVEVGYGAQGRVTLEAL